MGREVRFQTGTDEHGLKMAQKARDLGVTPRQLCDEMSQYFQDMCDELNISYDRFIRTTEPAHHIASQALWQAMAAPERTDSRPLPRSLRRLVFDPRRGLLRGEGADRRGGGRKALAAGHPGRVDRRGKLVLPPLRLPGPPAGTVPRPARFHPPGKPPQRSAALCRGGLARSLASRAPASTGASRFPAPKTMSCMSGSMP